MLLVQDISDRDCIAYSTVVHSTVIQLVWLHTVNKSQCRVSCRSLLGFKWGLPPSLPLTLFLKKLRYGTRCFDICVHCELIPTLKLCNTSICHHLFLRSESPYPTFLKKQIFCVGNCIIIVIRFHVRALYLPILHSCNIDFWLTHDSIIHLCDHHHPICSYITVFDFIGSHASRTIRHFYFCVWHILLSVSSRVIHSSIFS